MKFITVNPREDGLYMIVDISCMLVVICQLLWAFITLIIFICSMRLKVQGMLGKGNRKRERYERIEGREKKRR